MRTMLDDLRSAARTGATPAERDALTEMYRLLGEARGDHPALADVRQAICAEIDKLTATLRACGVDVDALLDEIEGDDR